MHEWSPSERLKRFAHAPSSSKKNFLFNAQSQKVKCSPSSLVNVSKWWVSEWVCVNAKWSRFGGRRSARNIINVTLTATISDDHTDDNDNDNEVKWTCTSCSRSLRKSRAALSSVAARASSCAYVLMCVCARALVYLLVWQESPKG